MRRIITFVRMRRFFAGSWPPAAVNGGNLAARRAVFVTVVRSTTSRTAVCQSTSPMVRSHYTAAAAHWLRRCGAANLTKMTSVERPDFMQS